MAWESFKPALENAAEQAEQGLRMLGIEFDEWKLGAVERFAPAEMKRFEGLSVDESTFSISVKKTIETPSRHDVAHWACIIAHEVTHCARFEREMGGMALRLAASEGLSYSVEQDFSLQGKGRRRRFFDFELDVDSRIDDRSRRILHDDAATIAQTAWLYESPYGELRNIDYFGLYQVQQRINEGYKLKDLLSVPSEELLGL